MYRDSFIGTVLFDSLVLVQTKDDVGFYTCPCGGNDHYSTRGRDVGSHIGDGFSCVLHCRENNHKWMILSGKIEDNVTYVSRIIRVEEEKFLRLLDGAASKIIQYIQKKDIHTITAQDLFTLHATHGYDPSVVEVTVGTIPSSTHDGYRLLMEEHKQISKSLKLDVGKSKEI
jgi:hypothetical protein